MVEKIMKHPAAIVKEEAVAARFIYILIGVTGFIVLTAVGAFIRIPLPFTPVPLTLQTLFVLLSGALLGRRFGPLSQGGYVFLGSFGVPLFAGGGGFLHILGPTGGYLIGFIVASWIVGRLLDSGKGLFFTRILLVMAFASLVIYLLGALHLALVVNVGFRKAIFMGVLPFIPGDTLKLLAAALLYWRFNGRLNQVFPR
ncbi:MAG: biotin transporter BioY [Syntrophobacterales bacterium]|nr:MAG: biotin transporter BioY [Syntrophobacterales bacterium]